MKVTTTCQQCGKEFGVWPFQIRDGVGKFCSRRCHYDSRSNDVIQRFWVKAVVGTPDACWPWIASKDDDGYGNFKFKGKWERASRVAWMIVYGPIPPRKLVCHSCDNPCCVNPQHLWLGAHSENTSDSVAKGRHVDNRGEKQGSHKLTELDVIEIRKLYNAGMLQRIIAERFGVSRRHIGCIVNKEEWRHIP